MCETLVTNIKQLILDFRIFEGFTRHEDFTNVEIEGNLKVSHNSNHLITLKCLNEILWNINDITKIFRIIRPRK